MSAQLRAQRPEHRIKRTNVCRAFPILFWVVMAGPRIVAPASASTIAEIAALPEGTSVTTDAVVILSTTDLVADPGLKSFQIRDATRAMTIYGTNAEIDAALTGFGSGDIIDIAGQTARLDGGLMLHTGGSVGGFAVSGRTSSNPMPNNPVFIASGDIAESYESNLVCLQNVSFDVIGGSGVFAVETNYDLVGGGVVRVVGGDQGVIGQPIPFGPVNITGIVIPDPAGDGYCLAPRGMGDIVPEPATLALFTLGGLSLLRRRW